MQVAPFTDFQSVYEALSETNNKKRILSNQLDTPHQQRIPACFQQVLELHNEASLKRSLEIIAESIPPDTPHHAVTYLTVCEMTLKKTITEAGVVDNRRESIRNMLILMRLALQECSIGLVAKKGLEMLQVIETLFESQCFDSFGIETGALIVDILWRIRTADWSQLVVQRCIQRMISSSIYNGAKVRKRMIHLVGRLLGGEKSEVAIDTCVASTVATLNQTLDSSNESYVYRSLQLMQVILPFFPRKEILQLLEKLLLSSSEDAVFWELSYAVVSSVLRIDYERTKSTNANPSNWLRLKDSDVYQLLNTLLQKGCPSPKMGLAVLLGYVWCLCFGIGCLETVPNVSFVCSVIEKLLSSLEASTWLNTTASHRIAQVIIRFIVLLGQKFPFVLAANSICSVFCQLTSVRFSSIFIYACEILSQLLTTLVIQNNNNLSLSLEDKESESITQILNHLISIRNDLQDKTSLQQVYHIFGSCLKHGGAKYMLHIIPLEQSPDDIHNIWLLDLLCKYSRQSSLQLFCTHLLPLYKHYAEKVYQATQNGLPVEAKNWRMYQLSVWSAFASFCREPMDIDKGLLQLREPLMEILRGKDSDIQMEVIRGFRNLCQSVWNAQTHSAVLSNAMKEILVILFRMSFECPLEKRNLVIETITLGAKVCSSQSIIADYLRKIIKRLLDSITSHVESNGDGKVANQRGIWLQLAIALMESHVLAPDTPEMQLLRKALLSNLAQSQDGFLQKKSYRALLDMLMNESVETTEPILSQVAGIRDMWDLFQKLTSAQNSVTAGARALRITSMSLCMRKLSVEQFKEALPQTLTEWILSTRDQSAKTRNAAFQAILDAVARYRNSYSVENVDNLAQQEQLGLQEIFSKVIAGLAGKSTTMLAATMDTIGRIVFEYRGELEYNSNLRQMILQLFIIAVHTTTDSSFNEQATYPGPVTLLLQHPCNEVVRSALNLVKIIVSVLRDEKDLLVVAQSIMSRLLDVSYDSKEDLRRKVKVILERLLRRCEVSKLASLIPQQHEPLFRHVRKTWQRTKRKKQEVKQSKEPRTWDEALQDDDIPSVQNRNMDSATNDEEEEEEEPLDILSTTTTSHEKDGMRRNKVMKDSRKGKEVVQYTDTGRIIIQEEDSTSVKPQDSSDEQVLNSSSGNKRVGNAFMHKEKRQRKSEQLETGAKFRSSKARGDVQKPGMPQPFAYIPLHLGYSHGKMDGKSKTGKKNAWRQKRKLSQK